MSYNNALPVPFASPLAESAQYARELLDHPLSNIYDSRCVVTVEMLMTRGKCIHNTWEQRLTGRIAVQAVSTAFHSIPGTS